MNNQMLFYIANILVNDVLKQGFNIITVDNLGYQIQKNHQQVLPPRVIYDHLKEINYISHAMGLPLLSALVVDRLTYQPPKTFYVQYRELKGNFENEETVYQSEVKQIMDTKDWQRLLDRLQGKENSPQETKNQSVQQEQPPSPVVMTEAAYYQQLDDQVRLALALSSYSRLEKIRSSGKPKKITITKTIDDLDPHVIAEVLNRARGMCENCLQPAPFYKKSDYQPYLEIYVKKPLEQDGEANLENLMAVCPNCHQRLIHGL